MNTINIIDAGCGIGKTTAIINKINEDNSEQKYLFITPFLDETERISRLCPTKNFYKPDKNKGTKLKDLIRLFSEGKNIVTTHALFKKLNYQILDLAKMNGYILIMDEVADTIEELQITKSDIKLLEKEYISVNPRTKLISWKDSEYKGKLDIYKNMIEMNSVYAYTDENDEIISLIWLFPYEIFSSFKEIFILTYMFESQIQKKYFDYFNANYKFWYVKDFHITEEKQVYDYSKQKNKISICKNKKLNEIGKEYFSLSISWFNRNKKNENINIIKKNIYNYVVNITKSNSKDVLWTTFQEYKNIIKGKGYSKGFAPINSRATNKLKSKRTVVYIGNRFLKPTLKNFFINNNIPCDEEFEESFALSELVQFIYRSRIRDNLNIDIYIPSIRMRNLLINWLKKPEV